MPVNTFTPEDPLDAMVSMESHTFCRGGQCFLTESTVLGMNVQTPLQKESKIFKETPTAIGVKCFLSLSVPH